MTPKTAFFLVSIIGFSLAGLWLIQPYFSSADESPADMRDLPDQSSPGFGMEASAALSENQISPPEPVKLTNIELIEQHLEDDGSGIREIRGSFRNNGTTTIQGFDIRFDLISENGSVIGEGSMLGWDIGPNETRDLTIIIMNEEMQRYNFSGAYAV